MRRTLAALGAGVLFITTLSGCGSSQTTVKNGAFDAKQPIPASQAFKQKSIWYSMSSDEIGKDSKIQNMLIFDGNGNVTSYAIPTDDTNKLTLGDLKGKTDEEIITLAKQKDKQEFELWIQAQKAAEKEMNQRSIESSEDLLNSELRSQQSYSDVHGSPMSADEKAESDQTIAKLRQSIAKDKDALNKVDEKYDSMKYQNPKPSAWYLNYTTDQTGNNLKTEGISYTKSANQTSTKENQVGLSLEPITKSQVYDMWFGGYSELLTKVQQDNAGFTLDKPGTEGLKEIQE
ncbi:hypothetical protein [Bifidobacterium animalis]|uniref:hypothetical protein n=1 Tax=Bifidobacterium animalis TaxID=28025 RepID=UPI0012B68605|nr:hypothetical protein [Bifidobacterium animalis]